MPSNCEVSQPLLLQMSSITICSTGNGGTEGVKMNSNALQAMEGQRE